MKLPQFRLCVRCLLSLTLSLLVAGSTAGAADWPQFRGPNRDNISAETGLLRAFPAGGPKVLWRTKVAQGYAGAAIRAGKVYVNDYDEAAKEHLVRCLSLDGGKDVWSYRYKTEVKPNHAITRTVPAVGEKVVYSLDPNCGFHAIDAATGKLLWQKILKVEYKAEIPAWYAGQNPLLFGDGVAIAVGGSQKDEKSAFEGDVLAVAFDASGKEVWRTPNTPKVFMSHSSLMPAEIGGVKQLLYFHMKGVLGMDAADGKILWSSPFRGRLAVAASPVAIGDGRVFLTSCYEAGSEMIRVEKAGDAFSAKKLYSLRSNQFNSEVHTPILWKDHLFAVGKIKKGRFTCVGLDGKVVWESPVSFGLGSFFLADGMFFILDEDSGMLRLVEADPTAYKEIASAQVLGGTEVWGPMALSGGKLVLRDMAEMLCIEVGGAK